MNLQATIQATSSIQIERFAQVEAIFSSIHARLRQHPAETAFVAFEVVGGDPEEPGRRRFVRFVATEERLLLDLPRSLFRGDDRARLLTANRGYWQAVDRPGDCHTPGTAAGDLRGDPLRQAWPWSEQPLACAELFWLLFDFWPTPETAELVAKGFAISGPDLERTAWGETPLAGRREHRLHSAPDPAGAPAREPCPCCGRTPAPGAFDPNHPLDPLDPFDPTWREPDAKACRFCRQRMQEGILLIEVEDWGGGPPGEPRRTGRVACVAETGLRRCVRPVELLEHTLRKRYAFVSQAAWKSFGLAKAGRGELN